MMPVNDAEFAVLKDEILEHTNWWIEWLGLSHWEWVLRYERERCRDEDENTRTEADVHAEADRLMFTIRYYLPSIAETLDEYGTTPEQRLRHLERIIVHELCHVLVAELRPAGWKEDSRPWGEWIFHEERAVAQLTLAFMWIADHGGERPRALAVKALGQPEEVKIA